MTWECSECGIREKADQKITICHHCGKTVCKKHREVISDDAFSGGLPPNDSHVAVHCLDCKRDFHKSAQNIEAGFALSRKVGA